MSQLVSDEIPIVDVSDPEEQDLKILNPKSRNKKLLSFTLLTLLPVLLITVLAIYYVQSVFFTKEQPTNSGHNSPTPTREDFARIAREVYSRHYEEIASLDFHSGNRKLLEIHIPVGIYESRRRDMLRVYQINPFKDKYGIDFKFIIGEPESLLLPLLKAENATYGDIFVIPGYMDYYEGAKKTKTPEWYKYKERSAAPGDEYKFVGRLDGDAYVNFDHLFGKYFTPEIQAQDTFTILALWVIDYFGDKFLKEWKKSDDWPQGAFYIFSWKQMLMFNKFYTNVPKELYFDDELIGRYIYDANMKFTKIRLNVTEAGELKDFSDWEAKYNKTTAVRMHELKDENNYIKVASDMLDAIGYKFPE